MALTESIYWATTEYIWPDAKPARPNMNLARHIDKEGQKTIPYLSKGLELYTIQSGASHSTGAVEPTPHFMRCDPGMGYEQQHSQACHKEQVGNNKVELSYTLK